MWLLVSAKPWKHDAMTNRVIIDAIPITIVEIQPVPISSLATLS
jgi:hypothetical protein